MKKKFIIIIPLFIVLITLFGVFLYLRKEDNETSLTIKEKRWLENNAQNRIDIEVLNDYPLLGVNGNGIIFQFINDLENTTNISFNKIAYLKESQPTSVGYRFRILNNDEVLSENDLLLFEDSYILMGLKEESVNNIQEIKNRVIGILDDDIGELTYFLKSSSNVICKGYATSEDLFNALYNNEVDAITIPYAMYLDKSINSNTFFINYYFTEMSHKIVLTLSNNQQELNTIITKYFKKWKEKYYVDSYNEQLLNYYIDNNSINDKTRADLITTNYTYGYVENYPYEVKQGNEVNGIAIEYMKRITRLTGIEFTYKRYSDYDKLNAAITKGEIDIYLNRNNVTSNYLQTKSPFIEQYVVLGKPSLKQIVTSFESLKSEKISMLKTDSFYNYFANNSKALINTYDKIDNLLNKNAGNLIVIDKEIYNYYRNNKFSKYEVLYTDTMTNDFVYGIKKDYQTFYDLFNYIIKTNSYYRYRNSALETLNLSLIERTNFQDLYLIVLGAILLPIIIIAFIFIALRNKHKSKEFKKEERRKYTDMLTSLKNRNYLNLNINKWEECQIYPQSIIIIDLNNVKYVNDNHGREAGDKLIIKAASILINMQLENSEIIRTDGNEFLIYLVGYSEKQIITYTDKLTKEFKELPHHFGAAIGYSLINDDVKTIDDAINEATLEMRSNKEQYK